MRKLALLMLTVVPLLAQRTAEEIGREHLSSIAKELGLETRDLSSLYLVKNYVSSNNGVRHLLYRQQFGGFEVAGASYAVNIDKDGNVLNDGGQLFAAPEVKDMAPTTGGPRAVRAAVAAVNPKVGEKFEAVVNGAPLRTTRGFRFQRGPLGEDPEGVQVWTPVDGKLQAGWRFTVTDTDGIGRYLVTLSDGALTVTGKTPLTYYQKAPAAGMVFERGTPQPYNYGIRVTEPPPYVDRTMQSFRGDPVASPLGWMTGNATAGNNVIAGENLAGTRFLTTPLTSTTTNGVFDFPLQLGYGAPSPLNFRDAATTNLFYWMNKAHDLHYEAGFDEASGNFQMDNYGRGGLGGDPVYVYSHFGSQTVGSGQIDNSYFSWQGVDDGNQAMIAMFLAAWNSSADVRDVFTDGSYDASVMVHEYTHGVSSRLVDGGYNTIQGASMGEAWSDFFGSEYVLPLGSPPDGVYPLGEYFFQSWGIGSLRTRPYSTDMTVNSLTFADIGKVGQYPEVHSDGEIWVEAMWEARANLIKQFGEAEGRRRIRRLVIDGMKLAVPNPTMVDARDAILLADKVDFDGASQSQLWAGFAKRGLGALAYSDGGSTVHVSASTNLPSSRATMKFYDNPLIFGEALRVVVSDGNYNAKTMLVQLTTSSGDLENLILKRHGNVFFGSISTSTSNVTKQNGLLNLVPGDEISAYYEDFDTGAGFELISETMETMGTFAAFSLQPTALAFANEKPLARTSRATYVSEGTALALPFQFPYFGKKYGAIQVQPNGFISFENTVGLISTVCTDSTQLSKLNGLAPLWMNLTLNGTAQPNEGIYYSSTPNSFTVRWVAETFNVLTGVGIPVIFAVTLYDDGRFLYQYGQPLAGLAESYVYPGCGTAPTVGYSFGHDTGSVNYLLTSTVLYSLRFDPAYNFSSIPTVTMTNPAAGDSAQGILTVAGKVADTVAAISRVDILIDDTQVARGTVAAGGYTATLDLAGLGVLPGAHRIRVRATNTRGAFADFPADGSVPFTVLPGQAQVPVIAIEKPVAGDTITGTITVSGYALSETLSITRMDMMIDGFVYGSPTYGGTRTDVCTALQSRSPNCPRVGFTITGPTLDSFPPIPDGPHRVQVRAVDSTGRITTYPENGVVVVVNNGKQVPVVGVVTAPKPNDQVNGQVTFTGWAYSEGRRITSATLLVDGTALAVGTYGLPAADACAALSGVAACPNIGFSVTVDTRQLLNGQHRFGIRLLNDRGDSTIIPGLSSSGISLIIRN